MTIAPSKPKTPSLFQITLESQEIDGELSIALAKASSEDPEEQVEAEALITSLLERANDSQRMLLRKANGICQIREMLLGKAEFLRKGAAERIAKAEAEERAAQRLEDYLLRCLQALHPGQTKFELPEFTISSRVSEAVEVDTSLDAPDMPEEFTRVELKLKLSGHGSTRACDIERLLREHLEDMLDGCPPGTYELAEPKVAPDKTAIKAAIKEGATISGAQLIKRRSWSIK
jgi:hypothetical protein